MIISVHVLWVIPIFSPVPSLFSKFITIPIPVWKAAAVSYSPSQILSLCSDLRCQFRETLKATFSLIHLISVVLPTLRTATVSIFLCHATACASRLYAIEKHLRAHTSIRLGPIFVNIERRTINVMNCIWLTVKQWVGGPKVWCIPNNDDESHAEHTRISSSYRRLSLRSKHLFSRKIRGIVLTHPYARYTSQL